MEHYDGAPESPPQNRRQFLLTIGSSVAAGVITADYSGLPVTRPFGELAATNHNFGAIGAKTSDMRAPIPLVPPVITATFPRLATWF
ncbi:MAG: hypothetical protein WCC32_02490 [Terriglobales bacterium]